MELNQKVAEESELRKYNITKIKYGVSLEKLHI